MLNELAPADVTQILAHIELRYFCNNASHNSRKTVPQSLLTAL